MTDGALGWAPQACSLPTTEQPLRLAEFDQLFEHGLRAQERSSRTSLRWQFDAGTETTARDLTARESACCAFFTFTITTTGDDLVIDVQVPPAHADVLDALQARAAAGIAS